MKMKGSGEWIIAWKIYDHHDQLQLLLKLIEKVGDERARRRDGVCSSVDPMAYEMVGAWVLERVEARADAAQFRPMI